MKKKIIYLMLAIICLLMLPMSASAVAGGGGADYGGGGYDGGGDWSYSDSSSYGDSDGSSGLMTVVMFAGYVIFGLAINRTSKKKEIVGNPVPADIQQKVSTLFIDIQTYWSQNNIEDGKDLYMGELYREHKKLLDDMANNNERNIVKDVKVESITNYQMKSDNEFWVTIHASVIDYTYNIQTNTVVSGYKDKRGTITQTWLIVKKSDGELALKKIK